MPCRTRPRPDVASLPLKWTATGWLNQPFASAGLSVDAPETAGGVASYWNETFCAVETLPAASVHVPVTDADAESGPL